MCKNTNSYKYIAVIEYHDIQKYDIEIGGYKSTGLVEHFSIDGYVIYVITSLPVQERDKWWVDKVGEDKVFPLNKWKKLLDILNTPDTSLFFWSLYKKFLSAQTNVLAGDSISFYIEIKRKQKILSDFLHENKITFGYQKRPANFYDFEIAIGWYDFIIKMMKEMISSGWDKNIGQVKEKYGGLRFYLNDNTTEQVDTIIKKYECSSYETCEYCGKKGSYRGSYQPTSCDVHYSKFLKNLSIPKKHIVIKV